MPTDTTDIESLERSVRERAAAKYEPMRTENEALKRRVREATIASHARAAAIAAGVRPEHVDDAIAMAARRLGLSDRERLIVLDADGDPCAVTPESFFAGDFKRERPWCFEDSDGSAGGGASTGTVASLKDLKTTAEKSAFIKQHGLDAFKALPRD